MDKRESEILEAKSNAIRNIVQDMLDGISQGSRINLDKFEKDVFKILKSKW